MAIFRGSSAAGRDWTPDRSLWQNRPHAGVVELVDAPDSKSGTERCVGSIPTARTIPIRAVGRGLECPVFPSAAEICGRSGCFIARFACAQRAGPPAPAPKSTENIRERSGYLTGARTFILWKGTRHAGTASQL
jgi:hypothetical protein